MSEQEYAELINKYQHEMYYIALSILKNETYAQDAVSETILRAFERREKLKEKEKFKAWLIRILVNVSYTQLKKDKKMILMDEIDIPPKQESKALGFFSTKEIASILTCS